MIWLIRISSLLLIFKINVLKCIEFRTSIFRIYILKSCIYDLYVMQHIISMEDFHVFFVTGIIFCPFIYIYIYKKKDYIL